MAAGRETVEGNCGGGDGEEAEGHPGPDEGKQVTPLEGAGLGLGIG